MSIAALPYRLLRIQGEQSDDFLQALLTADVATLDVSRWTYAALLNANGRTLALLRLWRVDGGFEALVEADQLDYLLGRLKLFVLRRKVRIEAVDVPWTLRDGAGPDFAVERKDGETRLQWCGGQQLCIHAGAANGNATPPTLAAIEELLAQEIEHGWPRVLAATRDRYIAPTLGLERLGAITYRKGCYPGQEIVARMRYRGKASRGLALLSGDGLAPTVGTPLLDENGRSQGEIVISQTNGTDKCRALAVLHLHSPSMLQVQHSSESPAQGFRFERFFTIESAAPG